MSLSLGSSSQEVRLYSNLVTQAIVAVRWAVITKAVAMIEILASHWFKARYGWQFPNASTRRLR